jgi:hypothetical protein
VPSASSARVVVGATPGPWCNTTPTTPSSAGPTAHRQHEQVKPITPRPCSEPSAPAVGGDRSARRCPVGVASNCVVVGLSRTRPSSYWVKKVVKLRRSEIWLCVTTYGVEHKPSIPRCPQATGLNRCKREETQSNHRPCGHVDDHRSCLVSGCIGIKNQLGTGGAFVPSSRRSMGIAQVVPRSSTARPQRRPQAGGSSTQSALGLERGRSECRRARRRRTRPTRARLARLTTSIVRPAALTPAFAGPYHRCFGAICALDLCLPSTMTGLRESFP